MNLTAQYLEDYHEIERQVEKLGRENAALIGQRDQLRAELKDRTSRQFEELRSERDELKRQNLELAQAARLWRRRHDDLARE